MPIKVLVNGAHGKMGQETVKAINNDSEFLLVGTASSQDKLAEMIASSQAEVVIDFTRASTVYQNACQIIAANVHPIIGTTGLLPEQITELQQRCAEQRLGGIIAPNFAIGAILAMQYASKIAAYLPQVEIIEMHHDQKEDAPSGTALKTAELLAQGRGHQQAPKSCRDTIAHTRGGLHHGIPIHAVRLPGIVAAQEILFGGQGETLSIRHQTMHRQSFMPGVLFACKKVLQLQELIVGLEHLL